MRRGLVLLALAALLPLILLAGGLSFLLLRQQQTLMRTGAVHHVAQMLGAVERELLTQVELLKVLAQSPLLDGDRPDLAAFHALAERFKAQLPLWHRVILADTGGQMVVRTGAAFGTPLRAVVDETSYRRVLETGEPTIGDVAGPGQPGSGPPRASFRVPVLREGRIRFVLTGVVSVERLAALLAGPGLDPAWRPYLVDGANRIAASARVPELVGALAMQPTIEARRTRSAGLYEGTAPDGEALVTAFRKSERTGWSVHLAIPLALYAAPQRHAAWILGTAAAAALLLSGLFILLLRRELRAQRQEALLHARALRMEALGRMTGGVAHDFNNLLMVILGNLEMLGRRLPEPRLERYVTAIRKAAERGTHLTRELLAFSRGQGTRTEVVDLNERLGATLTMIRQSVSGPIAVETDLAPGRHAVRLDPLQFDLALLNVAANARDAMPDGGRLEITTRRVPLPDRSGRDGVALAIRDTGSGITEEALPHVFEPFFTTKEVGKGTGLGLSQVYGFAKSCGGLADVESRAGQGTTITLHLPLAREPVSEATPTLATPAARLVGSPDRVVLVDDNDEVRGVTAAFLEEAGFRVAQASGAQAGLDLLEQGGADILVSDLVMPGGMDGLALANEVRRRWPALPVILVSGYSASAAAATEQGYTLYMKPFDMAELARGIRARIGRGEAPPAAAAPR
ncbi:integral membrane sensor hybrid histidine kinase [Methylobacterium sp. 4-46]|uniref:ATP-binding protein n=1 Tax=unclassified Methylobacterium TaxID=2615210 RepID=UPI000152E215|nr:MULTISPECIES: ATP-binding protein [Methylobacterium]ACA15810.1 integral membrane sensor hybrid histidine kinase [Methylobacterium sp. 4-46]WFT81539.1 ATP-binding protein [Methylobacterium nodulans]